MWVFSHFVPTSSCQRKPSLCIKTESALTNAAEKNLAQHPQDNDLGVFQSTLLQHKDLSLYKLVGKNSGRKRIRIWWREGPVSIRSTTTTFYVLPLSVSWQKTGVRVEPGSWSCRNTFRKNCLKVRLQLVFGHKSLHGEVISSKALELAEIKIRNIHPTGSFALGQFTCTSSPGTSPFADKSLTWNLQQVLTPSLGSIVEEWKHRLLSQTPGIGIAALPTPARGWPRSFLGSLTSYLWIDENLSNLQGCFKA